MREGPDGTRWIAQNAQVLSSSDTGWRVHTTADSARMAPIYSLVVTSALGDTAVVVGARGGVYRVRPGAAWEPVSVPGFSIAAAIVASRDEAGRAPELWIASLQAGVARYREGAWTTWGTGAGLDSVVEHIALAPAGDSIEALAATPNGAFALYGDRWRRVGPRVQASRVLRVRVHDRFETWIGSLSGEVIRSVDGLSWDTLSLPERTRGSRVQVLEAVEAGLAVPSVYAGFRSGVLLRFRVGVASRWLAPRGLAGRQVVDVLSRADGPGNWMWVVGSGAVLYPNMAIALTPPEMLHLTGVRARLVTRSRDRGTRLLAADGQEAWRLGARGWERALRLPAGDTVRSMTWAVAPDGERRVVLVTAQGAHTEADDGTFRPWPGFPARALAATVDSSSGTPALVVLDRDLTAWLFRDGQWIRRQAGSTPPVGNVYGASVVSHANGDRSLWVGTPSAVAVLRLEGGPPAWRLVDAAEVPALRWYFVRDLEAIGAGRIGVGTSGGLLVLDAASGFAGPVTTLGLYSDADGLPHQNVNSVGAMDAAGRLWLGTETGAGFLDTRVLGRDLVRSEALSLTIRDTANVIVAPGTRVSWDLRSLTVELGFVTGHREEDSRFRLELDGERVSASDWSESATASLLALSPGRHEIAAWAMDWRGVVAGPVTRTIVVLPPWYRTTIAWLAYAAAVIAIWWGIAEARLRRLRSETAAAVSNERRLAGSELRFRMLFEAGAMPELLVQRGRIVRANAAALRLLGDGAALVDQPVARVLPAGVPDERAGVSTGPREQEAHTASGDVIPVEVRGTVIPLDADSVTHVQLRDLRDERRLAAERRSLEAQLIESQRLEALGTLAGGVAHDFNNLLTVIQGNAELVADHPEAPDTAQSVRQILAATGRARDIVKQILTYSRRSRADFTAVRLSTVLDELQRMLKVTVPASVRVVVTEHAPGAVIHGDHTQLQQMLLNLATNAEYAMRPTGGGVLTIATDWVTLGEGEGERREVAIRVSDTGAGMTPEVAGRVFEPFFTTKPVGEGTGLGLSVLHGIVGAHGGSVRVESAPGAGTTFEVRLPAAAGVSAAAGP